ncbi:dnaJ, partial [Symbiodinium sp. CCMP2456]
SDWEALELPDTASKAEIKAQYRKLSIRYHPDKCKEEGAQKRFARIAEAYDALKDTDGQLAFPWDEHPERQQRMAGSDLIKTLGFLGAEAAQTDPIKAQFMQQVVKEATECRVLLFEKETQEAERHMQETWADALCVDERSGANHLVKVYRRIVTFAESALSAAKADMEEVDD